MHTVHRSVRRLPLAIALACALPLPAQADTGADPTRLDEIVVTGTRTRVALEDSLVPVQVIDRAEIERLQPRDLPDLLRNRAGIEVANQGGAGKLSSLFLRGTEADHVLVLVDGIRIGQATSGLAMFQDLPVEQIERIEIVRGPRSSLYGSEAIGGVVQVFTRRSEGAIAPRARIGAGSNGLREASAGIGGRSGNGWFGIDAAWQRTDGIDACRGSGITFQGCFVDEPDDDGYRNRSLNLRGGVDIGDALVLEGHLLHADADNAFDGSIWGGNEAENVQRVAGAKLAWQATDGFALTVQAGRAWDKADNFFRDAATGSRTHVGPFDTRRDTASVQADIGLGRGHLLSAGVDWQRDDVESYIPYDVTERDNTAGFVEYQGRAGAHRFGASLRHDDNGQFGGHATGSVGWGVDFNRGLRLNASYGTGFKAPSFNDLYYPFGSGNPDLQPEQSKSLNVGLAQSRDGWRWGVDAYETRIDDLIALDSFWLPQNIQRARIRGAELTVATTLAGWDLSTQISHLDPRDRSGGSTDGNLLARRARNHGRVDLDRAFGAVRVGATVRGAGSRYDDLANSVRLGGYGTVDLRASWAFHDDWALEARATNLLDKTYETAWWYRQPGREFGVALRYAPRQVRVAAVGRSYEGGRRSVRWSRTATAPAPARS